MSTLWVRSSGATALHAPDEHLKPELLDQLEAYLAEQAGKPQMVIPALQKAQALFGYVPFTAMLRISEALKAPLARVYGVATFYAQFRLQPSGRHTVRVCTGTACHVRGSDKLLDTWVEALGIEPGGTTPDGAITLERVACLGACGLAPAVMVDQTTHGRLTTAKVKEVLSTIERTGPSN